MQNIRFSSYYLLIIVFLISLGSCIHTRPVVIECLQPAEKTIAQEVYIIGVLDESADKWGALTNTGFLFNYSDKFNYDSIAADENCIGLFDLLDESPRTEGIFFRRNTPLDSIKKQVDALYRLTEVEVVREFYEETPQNYILKASVISKWTYHDFILGETDNSIIHIDSIVYYWEENAGGLQGAAFELPYLDYMVANVGYTGGRSFGKSIAPYWQTEKRYYYTGKSLKKGAKLAARGKWTDAGQKWSKLTKSSGKSIAAKAAHNMAVACEVNGDIKAAFDWVTKAQSIEKDSLTQEYVDILTQRLKNEELLKEQMK